MAVDRWNAELRQEEVDLEIDGTTYVAHFSLAIQQNGYGDIVASPSEPAAAICDVEGNLTPVTWHELPIAVQKPILAAIDRVASRVEDEFRSEP